MLTETHTANLLQRYSRANIAQKHRGRVWYERAAAACEAIALDTGIDLERVAAVMAITSPDAKLAQNIAWTRAVCEDKARRRGISRAGRYPADQIPKAQKALDQRRRQPGIFATGPKVSQFFAAIMGDVDCVVIDRWAIEAAGENRAKVPGRVLRQELEAAYRWAADYVGENARDFQAIVWIEARESTPRSDGRLHKHYDF